VNIQNNSGNSALIIAASWGHTAIVDSLLAKGAEVNVQNKDGDTALLCAAGKVGYTEVVDSLLAKGAEVNVQNNSGNSALITAASWGTQRLSTACWPRAPR